MLVTPWVIWIKPGLKIRWRDFGFIDYAEELPDGKWRVKIIDEMDRAYWVRLKLWQMRIIERW